MNVCARRAWNYALSAWKALQSVAIVTGYEVPGLSMRERGAWKALRHRTCNLFTATGVLPSRQNYCNCFFRGLRPRLLSLRSVVPSRHKRCMYTNQFQDKTQPFISDGFEAPTIHSQPVWLQTVRRISAGLTGFSGKIMRNARVLLAYR